MKFKLKKITKVDFKKIAKENFKKIAHTLIFKLTIMNFLLAILLHFVNKPLWFNENQILYTFATIAQVTGGLFGLTLAAYTLIDDKLRKIGDKEETSSDYSKQIRTETFDNLINISLLSIFSILLSLLVLALYRNQITEITIFFMLETCALFLQLLTDIYNFIKSANPNNIEKQKEAEKEQFDLEYAEKNNTNEKSFGSFITYYNLLEKDLKVLAQELVGKSGKEIQLLILDSLDILKDFKVISSKCYGQINELRLYRNSLVHSPTNDKKVNQELYEILVKIYNLFLPIVDAYKGKKELDDISISHLNNYIQSLSTNIDIRLLDFISQHPTSTMFEIAEVFNITIASAKRKTQKLVSYGYITKQNIGKKIIWKVLKPYIRGTFSFDYSNNNGVYVVGDDEWKFSTEWSKGSDKMIHAYSDPTDIECIARLKNVSNLSDVTAEQLTSCDYSSRCREIAIGDVAIWKNIHGHYLATHVKNIQDDSRGHTNDLLECEYRLII